MLHSIREAIINLTAAKQRSILALLGIMIGTASVIAMLNIGAISEAESLRQFREMGTNLLAFQASAPTPDLNIDFARKMAGSIPGIQRIAPYSVDLHPQHFQGHGEDGTVVGITSDFADITHLRVQQGRLPSPLDGFEAFAVLGADLPHRLAAEGREPRVGDTVLIDSMGFTVIGILAPRAQNSMIGIDYDRSMLMSLNALRRLRGQAGIDRLIMVVDEKLPVQQSQTAVREYLTRNRLPGSLQSAEAIIATMHGQARLFSLLLGAIGSISLIVGGIGVMNVMLVTVSERRREIGIRMAIGASQADIRRQFLTEGTILALLGGLLGTLFGLLGSYVFASLSSFSFTLSLGATLTGPVVSAITGIFFGYYPANQAAKMDPISALQSE